MSSSLITQDVGPMVVGYALVMGALAVGLRVVRRSGSKPDTAGTPVTGPGGRRRAGRARLSVVNRLRPGWPRLIAHCVTTAVGGYLLLMIVIILYYFGVAPISGNFVPSAFTGCLLLVGLSLPVFLALSWLVERTGWRI
jgi:polyferredoxin